MKRLFLLVALLGSCGATPPVRLSTERLLVQPPEGWNRVYQFNNVKTRLSEFVPGGESASAWTSKLTLESHSDLVDTDPIDILIAEVKRLEETCTFVRHFNLFTGYENAYPTSVRIAFCGENRAVDRGEFAVMKAIQGSDYLYLLRFNRRTEPFENNATPVSEEDVAIWSNYMSRISLCDIVEEDHACPTED